MTWPNTPIHVGVINEALQYKNRGNCYSKKKKINHTFYTAATVPKTTIVERHKIDTPNTHICDRSHSRLGTGTSIKMAGSN